MNVPISTSLTPKSFKDRTPVDTAVRMASRERSWPSIWESSDLAFLPRPTNSNKSSSPPWICLTWPSLSLGPELQRKRLLCSCIIVYHNRINLTVNATTLVFMYMV